MKLRKNRTLETSTDSTSQISDTKALTMIPGRSMYHFLTALARQDITPKYLKTEPLFRKHHHRWSHTSTDSTTIKNVTSADNRNRIAIPESSLIKDIKYISYHDHMIWDILHDDDSHAIKPWASFLEKKTTKKVSTKKVSPLTMGLWRGDGWECPTGCPRWRWQSPQSWEGSRSTSTQRKKHFKIQQSEKSVSLKNSKIKDFKLANRAM